MEDKRIQKTKRKIQETLKALLDVKPFEEMTVTEICQRSRTSRITFYTYFPDKYAVVEAMMEDYYKEASKDYHVLQQKNNPENDGYKGYLNLLECILQMCDDNFNFFRNVTMEKNPYLNSSFYRFIFNGFDDYIARHASQVRAIFSSRQTAAVLCGGLWSVIQENFETGLDDDDVKLRIRKIYSCILDSELFERVS